MTNNGGDKIDTSALSMIGLGMTVEAETTVPPVDPGKSITATFEFALTDRLQAGKNPAAIAWRGSAEQDFRCLAMTDLLVSVDDTAAARIRLTNQLARGRWSGRNVVVLENTAGQDLTLRLTASSPDRWLRITFDQPEVDLHPHQLCSTGVSFRRHKRWFGQPRDNVFDIHADGASQQLSTTGTFRQVPIVPLGLLKAVAIVIAVVLLLSGAVRLARHFVDDDATAGWSELSDAPPSLPGRSGHTITWVNFDQPELDGDDLQQAASRAAELVAGTDSDTTAGVVVLGGTDDNGNLIDAGAFFSATEDTWQSISGPGDEGARDGHTAVWTGDRLVVWGGFPSEQTLASNNDRGYQLDPTVMEWTQLPKSGLTPRVGHTMIWTGREIIVFGGFDADGTPLSDGGILHAGRLEPDGSISAGTFGDFTAGVWSRFGAELATFPFQARALHAAAWTGQYLVITGGINASNTLLKEASAYDVANDQWMRLTYDRFEPRACHQMVFDSENVVILGGLGASDIADGAVPNVTTRCTTDPITDRKDPFAWSLKLNRQTDFPDTAAYFWTILPDAPRHLATDFAASWTGTKIGIAAAIPELETVAPMLYEPGAGFEVLELPTDSQLAPRTDISVAWLRNQLMVWGGHDPEACDDDPPIGCALDNGAQFDAPL